MRYIISELLMSNIENNNDKKNCVQSKLILVKDLNEVLSIENAATLRIASRIDNTPIRGLKQILRRHQKVTNIQKIRLREIINQFGEKPTDTKADLLSLFVTSNIPST